MQRKGRVVVLVDFRGGEHVQAFLSFGWELIGESVMAFYRFDEQPHPYLLGGEIPTL